MLGVGLGFLSSVSWGISDLLGGIMSRRIGAIAVLYLTQPIGLALALGAVILLGEDGLTTGEAAAASGGGAMGALALGAFYRGLAIGPISVVATLSALGVMVPVGVGLARGEVPEPLAGVGIALAVSGGVMVAREPGGWSHPSRTAIALAIAAAIGFGCFFVGIDAAADSDAAWAVVAARVGGVAMLIVAVPLTRPKLRGAAPIAGPLMAIGAFDVGANALFAVASSHGLLTLVAPAASLYAAVTVILARVFLAERVPPTRIAAIAVALGGVVLIASQS